eukprot:TRINITY_DN106825_c0_g1_i1.p1 TRINITY_DN106825_c0_g1~~TRINITY_DN106825_c0_g1_i1.p1  ORF type:complete len:826 (-),score=171.56 TRINITY_DN106825_c0_g1_i1:12-2489(-)
MSCFSDKSWSGTPMWQIAEELEEKRKKREADEAKKASTPVAVLSIRIEGEHNVSELMLFIPSKVASGGFKEVKIRGPRRKLRAEAIKDGFELRKSFHDAGEEAVHQRRRELQGHEWKSEELPAETAQIEEPADLEQRARLAQRPAGTGWSRKKDAEFFLHTLAPMAYDPKKKQYYEIQAGTNQHIPCDPPHDPTEYPITVSAGASLAGQNDTDITAPERPRSLLLKELVKTGAAMKKPMFFLDQPASCFALFEGVRGTAAVDWASKNFHTKLFSRLSSNLQYWSNSMIENLLSSILEEMDCELTQQATTCYDGASLGVALFLGDRLIVATLGAVRGLWLNPNGEVHPLGGEHIVAEEGPERQRVDAEFGAVRYGEATPGVGKLVLQRPLHSRKVVSTSEQKSEIERVLDFAPDSFAALGFSSADSVDGKTARSLYKKLALKVHPDKAPEDLKAQAKEAFAKVEAAAERIEALCETNAKATEKLHKILQAAGDITSPVMPQSWARALLGIEESLDLEEARNAAQKRVEEMKSELGKLGLLADGRLAHADAARAGRLLDDALEVLRAPVPKEGTKLEGVKVTRALGLRDLKRPRVVILAKPQIDTLQLEGRTGGHHLVLLSSAVSSAMTDAEVAKKVRCFARQPKSATLSIAQEAAAFHAKQGTPHAESLASAVVALFEPGGAQQAEEPPTKKMKTAQAKNDQGDKIRCYHILLKHKDLRLARDPGSQLAMRGKPPVTRSVSQAERELLEMQKELVVNPNLFPTLARKHSECDSATQPGQSAGDLGWVARGDYGDPQLEACMFALRVHEVSDIISTPRGLHIIQRIA